MIMEKEIRREETEKKPKEPEKKESEKKSEEKVEKETEKEPERKPKEEEESESGIVERKPWTKWTKEDRKRNLRKRRHGTREKWFVLLMFFILLLVFLAGMMYSITHQLDPAIITIMITMVILTLIGGVFSMSHIWHDTE